MQKDNPPVMLERQFLGQPYSAKVCTLSAAQSVYSRYPSIVKAIRNIDPELMLEASPLILKG